ncbi:MAG: hypothetical protein PF961_23515 [Planctomycetota bacterium]|nr:hypothetical protein [Planctomycetota bacterium]
MASLTVAEVRRVDQAESTYHSARFQNGETGLVVILRREQADDDMTVHSTDYALAFESDSDIPRRHVLGISSGMTNLEQGVSWSSLGGAVSRMWLSKGDHYIALLFSVPESVDAYTLQRLAPGGTALTLPKTDE